MMEERAIVVDARDGFAWVRRRGKFACSACATCGGCGMVWASRSFSARRPALRCTNKAHAWVGDEVTVGIEGRALLKGSTLVYLVPILSMLVMALMAETLLQILGITRVEGIIAMSGLVGMAGGIACACYLSKRVLGDDQHQPVVVRRHSRLLRSNVATLGV